MDENNKSWADSFFSQIKLAYSEVNEAGIEMFQESFEENPEEVIDKFPDHLERILGLGGGIFKGTMCGGPYPPVVIPLWNSIGFAYPNMPRDLRDKSLSVVMGYLNNQRYDISQEHVEGIQEPWLVRDIIATNWLYWPGYKRYTDILKGAVTWGDISDKVSRLDEKSGKFNLTVPSDAWFGFAISREKYSNSHIACSFEEMFPEITDRLKDMVAGFIITQATNSTIRLEEGYSNPEDKNFMDSIKEKISHYVLEWRPDIERKMLEEKWIWSPSRIQTPERKQEIYDSNKKRLSAFLEK